MSHLTIEAFHVPGNGVETILIGEAVVSLIELLKVQRIPYKKSVRVVLQSTMSNRMQAALDLELEVSSGAKAAKFYNE